MSPLGDVLAKNGTAVLSKVERLARDSVAVRRALWRLKRQGRAQQAGADVWPRLETAIGGTTDYTELHTPVPLPQQQLDADEKIIEVQE
jgi:hypothetical protein